MCARQVGLGGSPATLSSHPHHAPTIPYVQHLNAYQEVCTKYITPMDTIQYYTDPTIHHPASCHCLPPILPKLHQVYLMKHFQIVTLSHTFFSNTILLVQYIQLKYSVCSFSYSRSLCAGYGALVIHGFGKVLFAAFSSCVVPGRRKSSYAWRSLWRRHKFSSQLIPVPHSNPCVQLLYSCTQLCGHEYVQQQICTHRWMVSVYTMFTR